MRYCDFMVDGAKVCAAKLSSLMPKLRIIKILTINCDEINIKTFNWTVMEISLELCISRNYNKIVFKANPKFQEKIVLNFQISDIFV